MQNISTRALEVKFQWLLEDQKFFNKYRKDKKAMQVINVPGKVHFQLFYPFKFKYRS